MPLQTYRYAACGGGNAMLGLITYFIFIRYIFTAEVADMGFYVFETHIAALFVSSFISFAIGFSLNRYIVFTGSYLKGRIQLFRYFLSFTVNLAINYAMLKLLVEVWGWDAVISQVLTIMLVIAISYFTQRHFTFKVRKDGHATFTSLK